MMEGGLGGKRENLVSEDKWRLRLEKEGEIATVIRGREKKVNMFVAELVATNCGSSLHCDIDGEGISACIL